MNGTVDETNCVGLLSVTSIPYVEGRPLWNSPERGTPTHHMILTELPLAGLRTLIVGELRRAHQIVLLLHGYTMVPEDLAPFAQTLRVGHTAYVLPRAPLDAQQGGHTWWPIDEVARQRQLARGPRDLAYTEPAGLAEARQGVEQMLIELRARAPQARLVLGGFSQGGMLACDVALHTTTPLDALFLLSSSMVSHDSWAPLLPRLAERPILLTHGLLDDNIALAAGERLRDALVGAGAHVRWVTFDGGHQIPLLAWRQLRRFLHERESTAQAATPHK